MQLLFQAAWEFIMQMLVVGRDSPVSLAGRPLWLRILLVVLATMLAAVLALALTVILFGLGAVVIGIVRGLSG